MENINTKINRSIYDNIISDKLHKIFINGVISVGIAETYRDIFNNTYLEDVTILLRNTINSSIDNCNYFKL